MKKKLDNTEPLITLRACLKLEMRGKRHHYTRTALSILKKDYGYVGTAKEILKELDQKLNQR